MGDRFGDEGPVGRMTDQQIAEASAAVFWAGDRFSQGLGFEMVSVAPGAAEVRGVVGEAHLNVHDTAHGGMLFALGGSAFGLACNSRGAKAVAQSVNVIYSDRAVAGEALVARAEEVSRAGKSAVFDIAICREDGSQVALLRGLARIIGGTHV